MVLVSLLKRFGLPIFFFFFVWSFGDGLIYILFLHTKVGPTVYGKSEVLMSQSGTLELRTHVLLLEFLRFVWTRAGREVSRLTRFLGRRLLRVTPKVCRRRFLDTQGPFQ